VTIWCNDKLMKWQVDKTTLYCLLFCKLVSWKVAPYLWFNAITSVKTFSKFLSLMKLHHCFILIIVIILCTNRLSVYQTLKNVNIFLWGDNATCWVLGKVVLWLLVHRHFPYFITTLSLAFLKWDANYKK